MCSGSPLCVNAFCKAMPLNLMILQRQEKERQHCVVICLFLKETLATSSPNRKQNSETLYECQIRRFLSDPLLDRSRSEVMFSALAEFAQKLSRRLPLHPFYPSLSPDSSACYLALGFPRVQISKQISPNQCWFSTQF